VYPKLHAVAKLEFVDEFLPSVGESCQTLIMVGLFVVPQVWVQVGRCDTDQM
jgi:hypothetical protein